MRLTLRVMNSTKKQLAEMLIGVTVQKQRQNYPRISFIRDCFLINVSWEFYNSPGHVTKSSERNNS